MPQHTQSAGIGDRGGKLFVRHELCLPDERMPDAILPVNWPQEQGHPAARATARRWPSSITGSLTVGHGSFYIPV
jgi:hypothetical protein